MPLQSVWIAKLQQQPYSQIILMFILIPCR